MKKVALIITIITLSLVSCHKAIIKPSDSITSEIRSVGFFDAIEVQDAIDVDITQSSNPQEVVVKTNSNLHKYIVTEIKSGKLIIRLKEHVNIRKNPEIKIHINTSDLSSIELSGASKINLNTTFNTNSLSLKGSGASNFYGSLQTQSLSIDISGATNVGITGHSNYLKAELSGASKVKDFAFNCNDLDINLSGASTGRLTINNSINIVASGASTLFYEGNATIHSIELSGASQIKKN